eukprot:48262_1
MPVTVRMLHCFVPRHGLRLLKLPYRLFGTETSIKYPIISGSINSNPEINAYNKMVEYTHLSLQPVLLNWYLTFILKGAMDTGILDTIPNEIDNNNSVDCISVTDLCNKCNIEQDITYRALRFMSSMGFTKEVKKGYFIHTKESVDLCKNGAAYYSFKFYVDPYHTNARFKFGEMLRGIHGFHDIHKSIHGESCFDRLSDDNARQIVWGLHDEMRASAKEPELIENRHFDLSDKDKYKKIIDIGGGIGELIYHICSKNEHIQGIVFDKKETINDAKQHYLSSIERDHYVDINMDFVEGDFFNENDVIKYCKDCDVIVLKRIIHDWSDEKCTKILQNIRKSIGSKSSVLLICDLVLNDELNDYMDLGYKLLDLELFYLLNGKERRLSEFDQLLQKCGFMRIDGYPKTLASIHIMAFQTI